MRNGTLKDLSVRESLKDFVVVRILTRTNRELTREFGVTRVPTFFVVDSGGSRVGSFAGYKTPEQFVNEVQVIMAK